MELSEPERAFAAEVSRCRAALGLTQERVAHLAGVARSKVSEVCTGSYVPSGQVLDRLINALGMDRERTIKLWKAARLAQRQRLQAERMARHPAPTGWTALPVLRSEIQALLRAQVVAATELPYQLRGARRPSLATVYVRQELGSSPVESQQEQPRPEPVLDDRGMVLPAPPPSRVVVRQPSRPVRDALDGHDHLLVTGGPGQGKSTLTLRLAADIAAAWATPTFDDAAPLGEPVVPLRLTARELIAQPDGPFPEVLAGCVRAEYGRMLRSEVGAHVLAERVRGCRWLLLIDGLDEIASSVDRSRLVHTLSAWAADDADSPYRVVLTTRPVEGAALAPLQRAGVPRYELQPFDDEALQDFARNWFSEDDGDSADRFVIQVRRAHLDELVRVPLLATIAAIIFGQPGGRPLPDNRYELYEAYLELLRSARPSPPGTFGHLLADLLEHLGRVRLMADTSLVAAARELVTGRIRVDDLRPGWHTVLTASLAAVGPLVVRGDDLRFLHHTFAEHLAATADARALPEVFNPEQDAFAALLHAARQDDRGRHARTVLLHYARLHGSAQADQLIGYLHAATADQHLIAARLLAQHAPASPDVVDSFLAKARDWARTTEYPCLAIMRQVSRAAYHSGLGPWLVGVMNDQTMPWASRVAVATALASRGHGAHATIAATLLGAVVHDEALPAEHRLTAAEGLAECNAAERAVAARGLHTLLADPAIKATRRRSAAVVLAAIGGRDRAVEVLTAVLDNPASPVKDLVEAAAGLTEIGVECHERSAEVFRAVLHDRSHTMVGRKEAAVGLAALGPHHVDDAVTALTALINDRGLDRTDRISAAEILAEMGPQHRPTAGHCLRALLAEPGVEHYARRIGASALLRLGTEFRADALGT